MSPIISALSMVVSVLMMPTLIGELGVVGATGGWLLMSAMLVLT